MKNKAVCRDVGPIVFWAKKPLELEPGNQRRCSFRAMILRHIGLPASHARVSKNGFAVELDLCC